LELCNNLELEVNTLKILKIRVLPRKENIFKICTGVMGHAI